MNGLVRTASIISAVTALSLSGALAGSAAAAGRPHAQLRRPAPWRLVDRQSQPSELFSIAAVGRRAAWAVGDTINNLGGMRVLRWQGSRWRRISVPGMPAEQEGLVSGSSASNVWLVGQNSSGQVTARWNGSQWLTEPSPVLANELVALSPTDVWVAGVPTCVNNNRKRCTTPMAHWNGTSWSDSTVHIAVDALSGSAAGNVWIVGVYGGHPLAPQRPGVLVGYRWSHGWHQVKTLPRLRTFSLTGVAAVSPANVWVDAPLSTASGAETGRLLHWNGRRWRTFVAPRALRTPGSASPLISDGRSGVWLGPDVHFTGSRWVGTAPGKLGGETAGILSIAVIPGTTSVWGVGFVEPGGPNPYGMIAIHGSLP